MTLEDLRQRYLWIAKNSLQFLEEKGFQKKGMKYIKQKGEFILRIYSLVPRAWLNSNNSYEFDFIWELRSLDPRLIQLGVFISGNKNLKEADLMGASIVPRYRKEQVVYLTEQDPANFDQEYAEGVKEEIETSILPLFDRINSVDDIIKLAEEDARLPQIERKYFKYGVYDYLARFYAYKGWKGKALEMCDRHIAVIPETSRYIAEEKKKRYIQYFEQVKHI